MHKIRQKMNIRRLLWKEQNKERRNKKKLAAKERRILANVSVDERKQVVDTKLRLRTKAKDAFPAASW